MNAREYALVQKVIDRGFRSLSKTTHPDVNGSDGVAMSELVDARGILKRLAKADLREQSPTQQPKTAATEITMQQEQQVTKKGKGE